MKRALFVLRAQPFHIGHLSSILRIKRDGYGEIIIGIGSSQESGTATNPFTAEERSEMIEAVLGKQKNLDYRTIFIPDINNYPKWVGHVENILKKNEIGSVGAVYTNNSVVKDLFEKANYRVVEPELLKVGSEVVTATRIRKMIAEGDDSWKKLVPEEVCEKMEKFDGVKRIKRIYSKLKG